MVKHAAAVLVLRGPRALGFSKYNLPGVSMPCGKVDRIFPVVTTYAELVEIKYETAVFDSNENHDGWWMEPTPANK